MLEIISALTPFLLLGLVAAGLSRCIWGGLIYDYSTNSIDLGCNCG